MDIFKNIILFFKSIFRKEEKVIKLEEKKENFIPETSNFFESLKNSVVKPKKKTVETLVCEGDGLGIQKKLEY